MATFVGTAAADSIDGSALTDVINGNGGNDTLNGLGGDDTLDGGTGVDSLSGGAGNDTYYVDNIGDVVVETGVGSTDTVLASVDYRLTAGAAVDVLGYQALTTVGTADTTTVINVNLTGNELDVSIFGTGGANVLDGGRNTNPTLGDTLNGYAGNDTYIIRNPNDVIANETFGTDTVFVSTGDLAAQGQPVATFTLGVAGIETLSAADQRGTDNLVLTGFTDSQQVVGNFGANTLSGGTGGDTLIGLDGNDTYVITAATDVIQQETGGTDTVTFGAALGTFDLSANSPTASIERIVLSTTTNVVTGNSVDQTLDASGVATGTAATLNGGAGLDTLIGHAGVDTYIVDQDAEGITETSATGTDTIIYSGATGGFNLANASLVEILSLGTTAGARLAYNGAHANAYLVGNTSSQSIFGANGSDILDGDRGAGTATDTLYGGAGSDIYRVYIQGDVANESQFDATGALTAADAGGANDTVYTSATYSLATNATTVGGDWIETLSAADQTSTVGLVLTGSTIANTIIGASGNDTLDGGATTAGDRLVGLGGNDTYSVHNANDVVIEVAGGGTDTINFVTFTGGTSYTLAAAAAVEVINLGSTVTSVTGNASAQTINGTTTSETISGGGGADTLAGGVGADVYNVSDALAVINDIETGVTTNVVNYTGTGGGFNVGTTVTVGTINGSTAAGDIYLVGNSGVQTITGNAGNNILNGAGGLTTGGVGDSLVGGAGDDIYRVYSSNYAGTTTASAVGDIVAETAGNGTDTVYTSASYVLTSDVENLIASDQANVTTFTLVGNGTDNTISGSNGNNVLVGSTGRDYLTGLGGADTFHFAETGVTNTDTIADFSTAQGDKISLDAGVFIGFGAAVDGTEFQNGTVATVAGPVILYDQATGRLFYDADGAGATAAVIFAQVNPGVVLAGTDFLITPAGTIPTPQ